MAQHKRSFCAAFFKKRPLTFYFAKKNRRKRFATATTSTEQNRIGGDGFEPPTLSV
jgi:hypothetical protein